jgi:hypothetical protein
MTVPQGGEDAFEREYGPDGDRGERRGRAAEALYVTEDLLGAFVAVG